MIRKDKLIQEMNRYTSGIFYVARGNQKSNIIRLIMIGSLYSYVLSKKLPRKNKKTVKNKLINIYALLKRIENKWFKKRFIRIDFTLN